MSDPTLIERLQMVGDRSKRDFPAVRDLYAEAASALATAEARIRELEEQIDGVRVAFEGFVGPNEPDEELADGIVGWARRGRAAHEAAPPETVELEGEDAIGFLDALIDALPEPAPGDE